MTGADAEVAAFQAFLRGIGAVERCHPGVASVIPVAPSAVGFVFPSSLHQLFYQFAFRIEQEFVVLVGCGQDVAQLLVGLFHLGTVEGVPRQHLICIDPHLSRLVVDDEVLEFAGLPATCVNGRVACDKTGNIGLYLWLLCKTNGFCLKQKPYSEESLNKSAHRMVKVTQMMKIK